MTVVDITKFRKCLSTFRMSGHNLMIEKGRHLGIERNLRLCPFCNNVIECEFHFVLVCPLYIDLRKRYIAKKFYLFPNFNKFNILMSNKDAVIIRNLAMYVYYATEKRIQELDRVGLMNKL